MNTKIIRKAFRKGRLKEYDLASAKVGDKVLGLDPGEVLFIYGDTVVFGWQCGEDKVVSSYQRGDSADIFLAPLYWVGEKPVYEGDTLYKENGKPLMARKLTSNGEFLLFSRGGRWRIDGSGSKLTWEPPQEDVFEVEGKPLKVGDAVFSRDGDKVKVVAFKHGAVVTTPGAKYGCTSWTTDHLSWTDPTILFEVEGKPVRKGDVLYSPGGVVIKRVVSHVVPYESYDREDNPVTTLRVYGDDGFWDTPEKLTWTKGIYIGGH